MDEDMLSKEKKKTLWIFMLFPVIVVVIILSVFLVTILINNTSHSNKIINYVKNNSSQLEKYVNGEIDKSELDDEITFKNNLNNYKVCNDETCFVKFEVDAYGFSTNSCYTGFYYSEKDIIHQFDYSTREITGDNIKSYRLKDKSGDNETRIKKIKDHWYYYEDCY